MNIKQHNVLRATDKKLITGDHNHLLPHLVNAINHASEIEIAVSFMQKSGLNLLFDPLLDALKSGASVTILTSDYLDITDPVALRDLMNLAERGAKLFIYATNSRQSFHLKSYIFVKSSEHQTTLAGCAFIGSSNLSKAALTNGHEWNYRVDYNSNTPHEFTEIREAFTQLLTHACVEQLSHRWIDDYLKRRNALGLKLLQVEQEKEPSIAPRKEQLAALEALNKTREQGFKRGLVVLATGMGKTWLSAFDVKQVNAKRVLFVAHREEILLQAQRTFTQLLPLKTGLYNGKVRDIDAQCLFASVQTLGRATHLAKFAKDHFDYIVVDEFHHASAPVYQQLLDHFSPRFLLGLTATPERTDQADILSLCDNNLVFERNLTQGIDQKTLVPFHYYGIWDSNVDYQAIPWRNGKFNPEAAENKLVTLKRAKHAFQEWQKYKQRKTLAFCISTKHADYMAAAFNNRGVKALAVHSQSTVRRNEALAMLENGAVEVLFTVDLFNEGTDLPSIDTILLLRPSESKILFLQQLGRGLRTHIDKSHLVVIDFIGNHHSFLNKPYALLSVNKIKDVLKQVNKEQSLPAGCFIDYDMEITDFWQQLSTLQRTTAIDDMLSLAQKLEHLPSATEFFYHYGDLKKVNQQHNGWFDLLSKGDDIAADKAQMAVALAPYYPFLKSGVQTTSMTKSFKAILLKAFVSLNGFKTPPTLALLAHKSGEILSRYPTIKQNDVTEHALKLAVQSSEWQQYWDKNPVKAYSEPNKDGTQWFKIQDGRFAANFVVPIELIEALNSAVLELTDYLLAKYSQRIDHTLASQQNNVVPQAVSAESDIGATLSYFPNLKIACGHFKTGDDSDVEKMAIPLGFGKVSAKTHFLARASGNSMNGGKNPILDGQLLLLEWITPTRAGSLQNATVAIERLDESGDAQYLLRDIKKQANKQGEAEYHLIAKNPDYDPLIADENMRTFARLKGVVE